MQIRYFETLRPFDLCSCLILTSSCSIGAFGDLFIFPCDIIFPIDPYCSLVAFSSIDFLLWGRIPPVSHVIKYVAAQPLRIVEGRPIFIAYDTIYLFVSFYFVLVLNAFLLSLFVWNRTDLDVLAQHWK